MSSKIKYGLYGLLAVYLIYSFFIKDNSSSSSTSSETYSEEIAIPTEGLITYVKEVQTDQFKIENEEVIADTAASLIIATYMDATQDTFTLAEARLMENGGSGEGSTHRRSGIARAASYGLMGYFMGRSMSRGPSPGAYVDQKTYDKVNNNAGKSMKNSASSRTVTRTRPSSGKSGYGGGRSTRSVGG